MTDNNLSELDKAELKYPELALLVATITADWDKETDPRWDALYALLDMNHKHMLDVIARKMIRHTILPGADPKNVWIVAIKIMLDGGEVLDTPTPQP